MANKYSADDIKKMLGGDSSLPGASGSGTSDREEKIPELKSNSYTADDIREMLGKKAQKSVIENQVESKSTVQPTGVNDSRSDVNREDKNTGLKESSTTEKNTVIKPNSGMIFGGSSFGTSIKNNDVNIGANNPVNSSYISDPKGLSIGAIDDAIELRENPVDIDVDKFLSYGYKMTGAERKAAAKYASDYLREYDKQHQQGFHASKQKISDSLYENSEYNKMVRLKNKASTGGRFVSGLLSSIPFLGTAYDKLMGLSGSDGNFMKRTFEDAETQGGAAYTLGKFTGNAALYSAGQSVMDRIPALTSAKSIASSGIGNILGGSEVANKLSDSAVNALSDLSLDIAFDTLPGTVKDYNSGEDAETIAKNAVKNVGVNTLFNIGGEALQYLPGLKSRIEGRNSSNVPVSEESLSNQSRILENVAEKIKDSNTKIEENGSFIDDIAETVQKTRPIPKSEIPKTSKLSRLDSDVTKLVKWYGDDSDIDRLVEFRKVLSDFENTGSLEYLSKIDEIASQLETSMKGKTYTYKDRLNKNGSIKRKGTTYTYGDTGGIDAALEDSLSAIDEIYTLKSTQPAIQQNNEIPSFKNSDGMTNEEYFDTFLAGGKLESRTEIPRLEELKMSSGEYVTKTATNTLSNSELFKNNPKMQQILQEEIDSGRMTFNTVTEDESIKAAQDAFKKDPVAEAERLMSSDSWKEAKDFDGGMMLLKSASDSGDYDTVRHMAKKIASEGHDAGVRLQALDKYSRTAEGTIAKAQSILDKQIKEWASNSVNDAAEVKRVSDLLKSEIKSISESASYQDIESAVKSIIGESKISKQITDQDITEISRMLKKGYASDIENTIDTILATQQYGISDEIIEVVQNIFEQANKFGENSKKRVLLENKAYALLANEITNSSWQDKWDTWRYLSMLSKPATHERNIIGNVGMNVVSGVKNNIAAALESTVDAVSPNGIQRTKSILNPLSESDRSLISYAAKDADEVAYRALSGSKYGVKEGIEGQAKAFRSGPGKFIQKVADTNSALLEVEDYAGLKAKYSTSLAGYLKANKVDATIFDATDDASKAFLDKAREYAISEAKKATFHEESTFADALSKFSQNMRNSDNVRDKAIGAMIEGVVPFKKTPINIVKTAGRYSPLSIVDAVFNKLPKALKSSGNNAGKYTVSQAIDSLASGLTGTGIMMLGAYMGSKGLIRGKGTGDEAQDSFDQLRGQQNYSIQFGDGSYTIDWMAPSVLPLLVGVELQKAWEDKGNIDSSELFNSIASLADPIVETTMMSGVSNALSNVRYSDSDTGILSSFATGLATGYATQGIPSTLGAVARAIDNTRRDSSGTQKGVLGQLEYTLNSTKNKIPYLSEQMPEYRDAWGRTQENFSGGDGSLASNLAYQLFSPGYYSEGNTTSNDAYLQKLYDKTGESDILPKKVSRSYNGEKIDPYTYSRVQKNVGQKSYELIDYLRTSDRSGMSDVMQAEIIPDIYSYAKDIALDKAGIKDLSGTNEKLAQIEEEQGTDALVAYLSISKMEGSGSSGGLVKDDWINYLDSSDLTPLQKAYIFRLKYPKSENPFD